MPFLYFIKICNSFLILFIYLNIQFGCQIKNVQCISTIYCIYILICMLINYYYLTFQRIALELQRKEKLRLQRKREEREMRQAEKARAELSGASNCKFNFLHSSQMRLTRFIYFQCHLLSALFL